MGFLQFFGGKAVSFSDGLPMMAKPLKEFNSNWTGCKHLDFFHRLDLNEEEFNSCIPLYFHTDGVKIYKNQKAWIYSYAAATRKGTSIKTKAVFSPFSGSHRGEGQNP